MTREKNDAPLIRGSDIVGEVGGMVDETRVSLGIHGPNLQPEEISAVLGCDPTAAHRRGDARRRGPAWPQGAWLLIVEGKAPVEPDELVQRLLAHLPSDPAVWDRLATNYSVRVRFGIFIGAWNRGFDLSPTSMKQLAALRATVGFSIYADGETEAG